MSNLDKTNSQEMLTILRHYVKATEKPGKDPSNLKLLHINSLISSNKKCRKHSKKQLEKLKRSIKKVGFIMPVVANEKFEIIAGELRYEAAKDLELESVPAIILDNLTEEEARAIRILDNRITEDAEWDYSVLKEELESLFKFDFKLEDFGFETIDYDKIFIQNDSSEKQTHSGEEDDESWLDINIPKQAKLGDLWRLGDHFIICGDSLDEKVYVVLMQGELAQIVVTDPPYNCPIDKYVCGLGKVKHEEFAMASGEMTDAEFAQFLYKFMENVVRFSTDGSLSYIFMDWKGINTLINQALKLYHSMINLAVWNKGIGGMGAFYRSQHELIGIFKNGNAKYQNHIQLSKYGRYRTNVWDYPGIRATNPNALDLLNLHPTCKNVGLLQDILIDASSRNEVVLDCFGGSGSTLLAAERTKRRARLIELNPRYIDVIIWRWERETGKKATLIKNIGGNKNE